MRWEVDLIGITWDDGKGEYDVSELPPNVQVHVQAPDRANAIMWAAQDASQTFGSMILGTKRSTARIIKR